MLWLRSADDVYALGVQLQSRCEAIYRIAQQLQQSQAEYDVRARYFMSLYSSFLAEATDGTES